MCVLLYIFFAFLSIVTVCGNLLIIISVGYFAQLRTPTNSLIVSLAVTDLLIGSLVIPFSMAFSLSSCLRHAGLICQVRDSFDVSLGLKSEWEIPVISSGSVGNLSFDLQKGIKMQWDSRFQ
uniref:G-protein coupled receptors family 1 profile domain-containing protein n=1 Tax=Cyprinodon variegatus TaxID=28743 RepID=A0A3Q2DHM6_CYPVA